MRDLDVDTSVSGRDGRYTATLHEGWDIWGPQGGYVAGTALRAAGAATSFTRPVSFTCHFLRPAQLGSLELHVEWLRQTRRAGSLRVMARQDDVDVLAAIVWMVDDLQGIDHDAAVRPAVPEPAEVRPWEDYWPGGEAPFPFWSNVDVRPVQPNPDGWTHAGDPRFLTWMRLRTSSSTDDPLIDAVRLLALADSAMFPAATLAHEGGFPYIAPSLDLTLSFHRLGGTPEWLLVDARSPLANGAIVAGEACIWSSNGQLLASARQQMLQRN